MDMQIDREPSARVDLAAEAGIDAMREHLAGDGLKAETIVVLLAVDGTAPDEPFETTASLGLRNPRELFAIMMNHARVLGHMLGIDVQVVETPHFRSDPYPVISANGGGLNEF